MDAVLGNAIDGRTTTLRIGAIDDLRINGGPHGLRDALARTLGRKVDGACALPTEGDAGFLRRDDRMDGRHDVAAGEEVGFDRVDANIDPRLLGRDAGIHHEPVGHLAEPHGNEIDEADVRTGQPRT